MIYFLPLSFLGNVLSLKGLNLRNCPIRSPPKDVVHQGLECILRYLRSAMAERPVSVQRSRPGEHLVRSVTGHSSNRQQGDHYANGPPACLSAICSLFSLFHSFKKGERKKKLKQPCRPCKAGLDNDRLPVEHTTLVVKGTTHTHMENRGPLFIEEKTQLVLSVKGGPSTTEGPHRSPGLPGMLFWVSCFFFPLQSPHPPGYTTANSLKARFSEVSPLFQFEFKH